MRPRGKYSLSRGHSERSLHPFCYFTARLEHFKLKDFFLTSERWEKQMLTEKQFKGKKSYAGMCELSKSPFPILVSPSISAHRARQTDGWAQHNPFFPFPPSPFGSPENGEIPSEDQVCQMAWAAAYRKPEWSNADACVCTMKESGASSMWCNDSHVLMFKKNHYRFIPPCWHLSQKSKVLMSPGKKKC